MSLNKKDKIDELMAEFGEFVSSSSDKERIETKALFIQLDILDEVKKMMKSSNLSRKELADKLDKSASFVSQLFSGDKKLNLKIIAQFQEIFDAKFVPLFKDYSEYSVSLNKNTYHNKGWDNFKIIPIDGYREKENKAA